MQSDLKRCLHRRYTVDVAEQVGRCNDCGIEGRMQFVGSDQAVAWNTRAEVAQNPLTREQIYAIKEGECIAAEDAYFKARSEMLDTTHNRRIFEAGFERGYDAALKTSPGEGK